MNYHLQLLFKNKIQIQIQNQTTWENGVICTTIQTDQLCK